ncbi:uncharacterized protein [Mytilus edulis]|uniref:uncharacterized protein n=1 Tax=Mytilus edulis TaxID=6550 RepID=UPI0039F0DD23
MVLMQTAKTDVVNPKNKEKVETGILFDSGSQRTYTSQSLASKLNLKGDKEEELKLVTFGSEKPKIVKTSSTNLSIKLNNGKNFNLVANIVPVISRCVHMKSLDASAMEYLKHFVKEVELADELPFQNESSSIELLIGNDHYLDLILSNKVEIRPGLYLLASKLGWIVTGRTRETYEEKSETGLLILSNTSSFEISDIENPDQSIVVQAGICDLWNLESIGIIENMETSSDKKAMEYFKETLKFKNGRYYVKWPWKENTPELPDNRELAPGRLKSCVARMRKKPDLLTKYDTIIQDQIQKGIVEEVNEFRTDGKHYIPRHAVITPIIISGKMFVQDLWKRNLQWDDELSTEDLSKWINISTELERVSEVFISRCVYLHSDLNDKTCKLLYFCDASARAYSAAVYSHQTCGQSSRSDLIFSKSRLAPVKEMSIPRLELMAVLIGVRSLIFVKSELNISIEEMYLWSDSQCVLKWISTKKELNVFVKSRIAEIKAHKDVKIMYVNTMENPVDVATRGTTASKLKNDSLW